MKNNNVLKYLTIIFFFTFIFIVPIITLSTPDKKISEIENKILTPLPRLNLNTIGDKSFMANFDKYSADQFPYREQFIKFKNSYSYAIGTKEFRNIYITKGNKFMEKFIFNNSIVDKNICQATKMSKFFYDNYDITSTLMVVPTSIAFYEKELPSWAITDNQEDVLKYIDFKIEEIIKSDMNTLNSNFIDKNKNFLDFYSPYNILDKYKDSYIYFNTDHHWTQLGARVAYEELYLDSKPHEFLDYRKRTGDFYGTFYSKAILPNIKGDDLYAYMDFNNYKISIDLSDKYNTLYDNKMLSGKNKYQYFLHGDPAFAVVDGNENSHKEILVFKDSYAHNFIPFLTSDYKKIHVVDPRYYNIDIKDYLDKNKNISEVLFINNIQTFNSADIYKFFK